MPFSLSRHKQNPKTGIVASTIPFNFELDMVTISKMKTKNADEARYRISYRFQGNRYLIYSDKGLTLGTVKAARQLASAIDHDLKNPQTFNPDKYKPTENKQWLFKNQMQIWLNEKRQVCKPSTVKTYEIFTRLYILPFFGEFDLPTIITAHGLQFLKTLPSTLSPYSKKHIIDVLNMFFNHCSRANILAKAPAMPTIKIPERTVRWADYETQNKILALIPLKHQPIFHFAIRHGMRIGEVIALQIKDIDLKNKEVQIQHAISRDGETSTKTRKNRKIPLHPELVEAVNSLCALKLPDAYLFTHNGIPYSDNIFSKIAKKAAEKLGIKISAYELVRHSLLSQAGLRKIDPHTLQKYAGHTHFTTTQKYMNLDTLPLNCVQTLAPVIQLPLAEKKEPKES